MEITNTYNNFYEQLVNINYYYAQLHNNKFAFDEDIKFDKLGFIDDSVMLNNNTVETFKMSLIMVNRKIVTLPSSAFEVFDFEKTMMHIHNILSYLVLSLSEHVDKLTKFSKPIDDVSMYVKMKKKDENRNRLISFFRRLKSLTQTFSIIVNRLKKLKVSEVIEFAEKIRSFEVGEYVKNDMAVYSKWNDVIKNLPIVNENDYLSVNDFLEYVKSFVLDIESQMITKAQTVQYYSERMDKSVELCKAIQDELFQITYDYDYMMKNILNKDEIEELKSQFKYLNSSEKK